MSIEEHLLEYPVRYLTPVAWGEMDAFEHVNNVVYFKYFESARIAYFDRVGYVAHMKEHGVGPILASTSCRFRRPLSYPDEITVGARVIEMKADRFTMLYRVVSHRLKDVVAEGKGLIVSYDYKSATKAPVPPAVVETIESLEAQAGSIPEPE